MASTHATPAAAKRRLALASFANERHELTVREQAAIAAMQVLILDNSGDLDYIPRPDVMARLAIEYADALVDALRAKGGH